MGEEDKELNKQPNTEEKKKAGVWILLTIIAFLGVAILGFLYAKKSSTYQDCVLANKKMKTEMQAMHKALGGYIGHETSDLKTDFQQMLNAYDTLIKHSGTQNDSLIAQRDSIQSLLALLKDTRIRSYAQINRLKETNQSMRETLGRFLKQLDSLNTLNIHLNKQLAQKTSTLKTTSAQRDSLLKQQKKNSQLLTKGARLNAFNFRSVGLKYKWMGSGTRSVSKAKNAEILSTSFTVGANAIAPKGETMVYLQIIAPNGNVLYKRTSDVVTIAGQQILYSGKRKIDYEGQNIDMKIVYNLHDKTIPSGNYKVKIFANGALIGKDAFTLK